MDSVWLIEQGDLPAPRAEFDLALWPTEQPPTESQARTWAGWAETPLIAGRIEDGQVVSVTPGLEIWSALDVAYGTGKIWRWHGRYLAWMAASDLRTPEIARALSLAGIELLVVSDPAIYTAAFTNPLWRAVQSEQIFGLQLGPEPQLFLPCEIDDDENGLGELGRTAAGRVAMIDFERLREARRLWPLRAGLRTSLYRRLAWWQQ